MQVQPSLDSDVHSKRRVATAAARLKHFEKAAARAHGEEMDSESRVVGSTEDAGLPTQENWKIASAIKVHSAELILTKRCLASFAADNDDNGRTPTQMDVKAAILAVQPDKAQVLAMAPGVGLRPFCFEHVIDINGSQQRVYELCGRPAVAELLNGQSTCVLVYGQTGSGKTHTMFGEETKDPRLPRTEVGIVPVSFNSNRCVSVSLCEASYRARH